MAFTLFFLCSLSYLFFKEILIMAVVVPKEDSKAGEQKDTIKEKVQGIKDTAEAIGKDI
jgi:hypothetical protein